MSEADKQAPINDNEVDDRDEEVRDENQENEEGGGDGDGDGQAKRGNRRQRRNPGNRRRRRNTNDEPEGPIEPIEIGKGKALQSDNMFLLNGVLVFLTCCHVQLKLSIMLKSLH